MNNLLKVLFKRDQYTVVNTQDLRSLLSAADAALNIKRRTKARVERYQALRTGFLV